MKSLKKFFKDLKDKIDPDEIEEYYGHGTHKHDHSDHSHNSDNEYKCPMKCEGDKTYDAPGHCHVCNMKLILVDDINQDTKGHHAPHQEEYRDGLKH